MFDVSCRLMQNLLEDYPDTVIRRGSKGGLFITASGRFYDGSFVTIEEALLNAYVYFKAEDLSKRLAKESP